jgi:hypothetical protein
VAAALVAQQNKVTDRLSREIQQLNLLIGQLEAAVRKSDAGIAGLRERLAQYAPRDAREVIAQHARASCSGKARRPPCTREGDDEALQRARGLDRQEALPLGDPAPGLMAGRAFVATTCR